METKTLSPGTGSAWSALRMWNRRQWLWALMAAVVTALVLGIPTDVIPNPVFGRPVEVTWWSVPVLVVTSVLAGLVAATYVRGGSTSGSRSAPGAPSNAGRGPDTNDPPVRLAGLGGLLGFFAIGCPVCNKLVVMALGTTGALSWFAPLQPVLAVAAVVVMTWALRVRLRGQVVCPAPPQT